MKCFLLVFCVVCVVLLCAEGKRGSYSSRSRPKSRPSSNTKHRTPAPPPPPPPTKKTDVNRFLDAERQPSQNNRYSNTGSGNQQNPPPIGFDNVNRGTNNKPIGFEGFNNPKPDTGKIGFEGMNTGNKPSAPVLPGNNYGQSNPNFGQQNPGTNFGQSYPGQKYPGQNTGQSYPNQQNPNFGQSYPNQQNPNFGQSYPNQQNPNFGHSYPNQQNPNFGQYPNQHAGNYQPGQPNVGHGYPSNFGQNYPSYPNNYGQSYPGQSHYPGSYGNSYQGQQFGYNQGFGGGYPNNYQQGYGGFGSPYGGNSFGGGGLFGGGGFFGSNNGFNSFGNGYNNYGKRSRFGFGGLPLPIPIPIPIPFGGFGGFGSGYNSHRSHSALNSVVQQASNDSNNATSVYIINNSTVLPCTREQFKYDSYNVSIVSCTVLNCTAVSLKTVKDTNGNIETNYGSVTMCLDPTATITTNSSGSNLPRLSDVIKYSKSICEQTNTNFNNSQMTSVNSTNGENLKSENNATITKETEETKTDNTETTVKPNITNENITTSNSNLTTSTNMTEKPCDILNCSAVELCMPKVEIHCDDSNGNSCNFSVSTYTSCVELKMCNSQNSLVIDREVKLNTKKDITGKDNTLSNQTYRENVTVIAYIPPAPLVAQNFTFSNGTACQPQPGSDPSNPCGFPPSPSSSSLGVDVPTTTVSTL